MLQLNEYEITQIQVSKALLLDLELKYTLRIGLPRTASLSVPASYCLEVLTTSTALRITLQSPDTRVRYMHAYKDGQREG